MASILSVNKSLEHNFSKTPVDKILLIEGEGVEGDSHRGVTVKHRSRVKADPTQPNLRQVHLMHNELIDELNEKGFRVKPSSMGENITTIDIDLLSLPRNTILKIGATAKIQITGLRNPCAQLNHFQDGLMSAVLDKDDQGNLIRKAGVMSIVLCGGVIKPKDKIEIILPTQPHEKLDRV
ncbi:MAG: MOSC domain-containing protein [Planctomycetota bacterium]|nr:MAG: MOSC domain-containing protein [Planctomycetota bacterium]